jgi:hypothetical protein
MLVNIAECVVKLLWYYYVYRSTRRDRSELSAAARHRASWVVFFFFFFFGLPDGRLFHPLCIYKAYKQSVSVGVANGYGMNDRAVGIRGLIGLRIVSSTRCPDRLWGSPKPSLHCVTTAISPGVKRPGREADHSLPTSAEVKKIWSIHPLPHTP